MDFILRFEIPKMSQIFGLRFGEPSYFVKIGPSLDNWNFFEKITI
jgi:hypothetical protein